MSLTVLASSDLKMPSYSNTYIYRCGRTGSCDPIDRGIEVADFYGNNFECFNVTKQSRIVVKYNIVWLVFLSLVALSYGVD